MDAKELMDINSALLGTSSRNFVTLQFWQTQGLSSQLNVSGIT